MTRRCGNMVRPASVQRGALHCTSRRCAGGTGPIWQARFIVRLVSKRNRMRSRFSMPDLSLSGQPCARSNKKHYISSTLCAFQDSKKEILDDMCHFGKTRNLFWVLPVVTYRESAATNEKHLF